MLRTLPMMACFALAGVNAWYVAKGTGSVLNWIAMFVTLGAGFYGMASLVRRP